MQLRLARPTLGRRLRIQPQVSKDLLDQRPLQDGGDDLELALKSPAVCKGNWPRAGARPIDFIASLQTARLCLQRLLWSMLIEQSTDRTQSLCSGRNYAQMVGRGCRWSDGD